MLRHGLAHRGLAAGVLLLAAAATAYANDANKTLKIGVIYDLTGPFAGGGSELHYLGAKTMIDWFIQKGPIEGYKIEAVYADGQSKPDVVINEATRLIEQEKVDMLLGFYSSAECVPAAARIEQFKKFMWITTCIASPVLADRHLKYVFRPQPYGKQWGLASTEMVAAYSKAQLGKDPKDTRIAIIHEDGAYGVDVSKGNEEGAKESGLNIVLDEGYSASAPDLSSLVTKLKRARPDVVFHTGYNPDISLFLRQARELGLRFSALIGHGAGYTDYTRIKQAVGTDANYFLDVDPISIWETNPKSLKPELPPMIQMVGDAYHEGEAGYDHQVAACRHGGFQHLPVLHRRAATRHQELWRRQRRCAEQGGARNRCAGRRHHAGLRRQVRARERRDGRAEHPRLPGGHPVHRRQGLRGVAEVAAAARAGAEAALHLALRRAVMSCCKRAG